MTVILEKRAAENGKAEGVEKGNVLDYDSKSKEEQGESEDQIKEEDKEKDKDKARAREKDKDKGTDEDHRKDPLQNSSPPDTPPPVNSLPDNYLRSIPLQAIATRGDLCVPVIRFHPPHEAF